MCLCVCVCVFVCVCAVCLCNLHIEISIFGMRVCWRSSPNFNAAGPPSLSQSPVERKTPSPARDGARAGKDWRDAAMEYLESLERGRQETSANEVWRCVQMVDGSLVYAHDQARMTNRVSFHDSCRHGLMCTHDDSLTRILVLTLTSTLKPAMGSKSIAERWYWPKKLSEPRR